MRITIISKVLGLVRESLIAARFGTSFSSDVYFFSIDIIGMIFGGIGVAISTTFIPLLTEYLHTKSKEDRNYFANNILNIVVCISVIISIVGMIFTKQIISFLAPGFVAKYTSVQFLQIVKTTRLMFITFIFIGVQNVFSGILQAHQQFTIPAVMTVVSNVLVIGYLILGANKCGVWGLIIVVVISFAVQAAIHIPSIRKLDYRYKLVINLRDKGIRRVIRLVTPIFLGTTVSQMNFIIDRALATTVTEGALAALNFGNKLNTMVYSTFGAAISTVVFPLLSRLSVKEDMEGYKVALIKVINTINIVMLPATVIMMVLRVPFITLIFKRGAFDASSVSITATVLMFFAPGLAAYSIRDILGRAFYAIQDTKTPMINTIIGLFINIILNLLLVKHMGVGGLALSTSISAFVTTILLFINLQKRIKFDFKRILVTTSKIGVAAASMGIVIKIISAALHVTQNQTFFLLASKCGGSIIVGLLVYMMVISFLKVEEYIFLMDIFKKKMRL